MEQRFENVHEQSRRLDKRSMDEEEHQIASFDSDGSLSLSNFLDFDEEDDDLFDADVDNLVVDTNV